MEHESQYVGSEYIGAESSFRSQDAPHSDWRGNFERSPWMMLGLAFGAGCLVAALVPSDTGDSSYPGQSFSSSSRPRFADSHLGQTWAKMQKALMVAVTRNAENFLDDLVPGFKEAYQNPQHQNMPQSEVQ